MSNVNGTFACSQGWWYQPAKAKVVAWRVLAGAWGLTSAWVGAVLTALYVSAIVLNMI